MKSLDKLLLQQFNTENYKTIFAELIETKTDNYTGSIKIPMGVDGLSYITIKNNIEQVSSSFCNRAQTGKYLFSPFRETQIPKAPYTKNEFKIAKQKGKLRTLSICTINDTIFQNMIYQTIYDYTENRFYKKLDYNIFGYRKGKSVNSAIKDINKYINEGYLYGLDGDIEKYFDKIDHERLLKKVSKFYGKNSLITKYITRFIKVKRVPVENKQKITKYFTRKPKTCARTIGIPQGGVLSGLLANLYLYNFDIYVTENLAKKFDINYIRYADDFLILCKDPNIIIPIYKRCLAYFKREKLKLHDIDTSAIDNTKPNSNKTKAINLNKNHFIEFLGFKISPKYIGVKSDNITKFKNNIKHIIKTSIENEDSFESIIYKINAKILGNGIFGKGLFTPCKRCHKPQKPQSWIGFFINITDMRILKNLDKWIRKELHKCYMVINKGTRLDKHHFKWMQNVNKEHGINTVMLQSLFHVATCIKNWYKKYPKAEFCECKKFIPDLDVSIS